MYIYIYITNLLTYKLVNGSKLKPVDHFRLIRKVSIL